MSKFIVSKASRTASTDTKFIALVIFFAFVFFMGGASRADVQSLLILRPISIFFLAYAINAAKPGEIRKLSTPFWLFIALASLVALQLIPMPPAIWKVLPNRQVFADLAELFGISQPWRPLSLSPSATLNSLFALLIPLTTFLLISIQAPEKRFYILPVLMIFGVLSMLLAIMQISGPMNGPLYFYSITNNGTAVGFFANRNHQAVFLAVLMVVSAYYFSTIRIKEQSVVLKSIASLSIILLIVPLLFVTGSRAGLLLGALALIISANFLLKSEQIGERNFKIGSRRFSSKWFVILFLGTIALLISATSFFARDEALSRFIGNTKTGNLRQELLPVLIEIAKDYSPFGSGFGSFPYVYKGYETTEMLNLTYLNQAHNDWLQIIIEGGLPALIIVLFFVFWLIKKGGSALLAKPGRKKNRIFFNLSVIVIILLASAFDYPLRTPIFMLLTAVFCSDMSLPNRRKRSVASNQVLLQ